MFRAQKLGYRPVTQLNCLLQSITRQARLCGYTVSTVSGARGSRATWSLPTEGEMGLCEGLFERWYLHPAQDFCHWGARRLLSNLCDTSEERGWLCGEKLAARFVG